MPSPNSRFGWVWALSWVSGSVSAQQITPPPNDWIMSSPAQAAAVGQCAFFWHNCQVEAIGCHSICNNNCMDVSPQLASCCSSFWSNTYEYYQMTCLPAQARSNSLDLTATLEGNANACSSVGMRATNCAITFSTYATAPASVQSSCMCDTSGFVNFNLGFPTDVKSCSSYLASADPSVASSYYDILGNFCPGTAGSAAATTTAAPTTTAANQQAIAISLGPVSIVTATAPVSASVHTNTPVYSNSGNLLVGDCATTAYTLIDLSSTVYYAPFVGCANNRPECCPWSSGINNPVTAATLTAGAFAATGNATQLAGLGAYPTPAGSVNAQLQKCAADYISVSGGCCPSGYQPHTQAVGGQTPCVSSIANNNAVPTLTAGIAGEPTDTSRPTTAVVNIVMAVHYQVQSASSGGLTQAGFRAGVGISGLAMLFCLF